MSQRAPSQPEVLESQEVLDKAEQQAQPAGREHKEAFEATKEARAALPADGLSRLFADIYTSAARVRAAATRAAAYQKELHELPLAKDLLQQVERHALAAAYAQTRYLHWLEPPAEVLEMIEELREHRETLYGDVQGLVRRKVVPAGYLDGINKEPGYLPVTVDVMRLTDILREVWPSIEGKTPLTLAELDRIAALGVAAEKAVEMRDDKEQSRQEANVERQRAFTLMVKSYSQLRRGLTFVLWDTELLDAVAPSMQVGTRRGKPSKDEDASAPPPAAGAAAVAKPGAAGASNGAVSGQPSDSPFVDG